MNLDPSVNRLSRRESLAKGVESSIPGSTSEKNTNLFIRETRDITEVEKVSIRTMMNTANTLIKFLAKESTPIKNIYSTLSRKIIPTLETLDIQLSNHFYSLSKDSLTSILILLKDHFSEVLELNTISKSAINTSVNTLIQEYQIRSSIESDKNRCDSDSSSDYDYGEAVFTGSIASGNISLHLQGCATHGSLTGTSLDSDSGMGFILKYIPNTPHDKKDWVQFVSRQILLDGQPVSGENRFKGRSYRLFTGEKSETMWNLDSTQESPFYADSLKSLPIEKGSRPIFDQPTGWSRNFDFGDTHPLNTPEGILSLLEAGHQITSKMEFKSYICGSDLTQCFGGASFRITWDIKASNIITRNGQTIVKAPYSEGVINNESIHIFESGPIEEIHQSIIRSTCRL